MSGPVDDKRGGERVPILGELHGEVTVFQPIAIRSNVKGVVDSCNPVFWNIEKR